jgi:anaerobic magnesium-protoporphyrin IX monomethyl ester cyclase
MISSLEQAGGVAAAKRIFLGNAPWNKAGAVGIRAGSRWPHFEVAVSPYMPFPFYLGYCTALLKQNGFEVLLIDAIAEKMSEDVYFERMRAFNPDFVVHEVATASMEADLRYARRIKTMLPQCKLMFAGPHRPMGEAKWLDEHPDVDFGTEGEYEWTVLQVAQQLGAVKKDIPGLIYRGADGKAISNGRAPLVELSKLPFPAREFLPMNNYWDNWGGLPEPCLQIHASRGCPFTCNFCQWPQLMYGGNKYRTRDAKDVVDEIVHCRDTYGSKSFYFDDDTFNIGKKRMLEISDELIRRKLNMPWSAMSRADTCDMETLRRMRDSGMKAIKYGLESGDQKILDDCGKKLDLKVAIENIKETKRLGIICHLTISFGLPGETHETIKKTMDLLDELVPDSVQFSLSTPYPGSELYDQLVAKGHLLSTNFDEYDGMNKCVVRTDALTAEEIQEAYQHAVAYWNRRHFSRKVWNNKWHYFKRAVTNPISAVRTVSEMVRQPGNA